MKSASTSVKNKKGVRVIFLPLNGFLKLLYSRYEDVTRIFGVIIEGLNAELAPKKPYCH